MKLVLAVLNLFAASLVVPAMLAMHDCYAMSAINMYVALDRAEILDHAKLQETYPKEIGNDRILIPKLYMNRKVHAFLIGIPCIVGFTLNGLLILVFWPSKRREQKDNAQRAFGKCR